MSEFVGCSSSLSGAFRVNPWNVDDVADAMYRAAMLSGVEAEKRHEKHWKYISEHTVGYWAASNISELQRSTETSGDVRCYGLGFGLNFRVVTLNPDFRKLDSLGCSTEYARSTKRVILLDYDGTLVPSTSYDQPPTGELLECIRRLAVDPHNAMVCIVSGRQRKTLDEWFGKDIPGVGLLAEHGYWYKAPDWATVTGWQQLAPHGTEEHIKKWHETIMPILEQYTDSTDGSFIKDKGTSVVWHYRDADPDFGAWQAKELMEHLESVLVNDPVDVFPGNGHVEIKPQGVSKGTVVEMFLGEGCRDAPARGSGGRRRRLISCSPLATIAAMRRCSTPSQIAWWTLTRRVSGPCRVPCRENPRPSRTITLRCTAPPSGRNLPRRIITSTTRRTSSPC